jgi:hypothetical protein
MSRVCFEVAERIEEFRNEAREECRNVTREVSERICSWMPWPFSELCNLVTRLVTELVCGIVWVVVTIVSWVTRLVCIIIAVLDWIIQRLIGILEWLIGRIISVFDLLVCVIGFRPGTKKMRICPLIIADQAGIPAMPEADVQRQIDRAVEIYRQCNVDLIFSPIQVVQGNAHLIDASGCDAGGYFSGDRTEYEHLSCCQGFLESLKCLRFPSGFIWPRQIFKAIWVRSLATGDRGCYMLPESFTLIASTAAIDTLAHEIGHACDLLHREDPQNLMTTPTRTDALLTPWQCCVIRSSRFVTYL